MYIFQTRYVDFHEHDRWDSIDHFGRDTFRNFDINLRMSIKYVYV